MVVVDSVAPAVTSCLGLSVDAELARDNRTVTFTKYTVANTIDALFNEFLGTYRSELRCMVVKAATVAPGLSVGWRNPGLHLMVAAYPPLQLSSCLVLAPLVASGLLAAPLPVGSIPLHCLLAPLSSRIKHVGARILLRFIL
jgi:hypothetical protein